MDCKREEKRIRALVVEARLEEVELLIELHEALSLERRLLRLLDEPECARIAW